MAAVAKALPPSDLDHLSADRFTRLAALIYDETGIKMPRTKATMLEGRLRRRVRDTGTATLNAYCDLLLADPTANGEIDHLINAVTTNKTDVFREPGHVDFLANTVLPTMVKQGRRRIRTWSAACSTGAEPYTMAMVLDRFAEANRMEYGILATDIDTEVLETARRGIYPAEQVDPVPSVMRQRYVAASTDRRAAKVRIAPELRSAIGFARLNLMDTHYPVGDPMDIIFCRNVLIYFDKPTQEAVVRRLCDCLRPGGYLFLGHSESIAGMDLPVKTVSYTVFERC